MKSASALQRGKACLSCRKRKMKCDGQRPTCTQCAKANREGECQYHDKKQISRTEMLRAKVAKLEARLRELEVEHSGSSSNNTPVALSPMSPDTSRSSPSDDFVLLPPPGVPSGPSVATEWDDEDPLLSSAGPSSLAGSSFGPAQSPPSWNSSLYDIPAVFASGSSDSAYNSPVHFGSDLHLESVSPEPSNHRWEDPEAQRQNTQKLLDIFFAHRHQCAFDVHVGRFRASQALPPAQQPHPALLDAMYLMACYFSQLPQYASQEPYFLQRALAGISSSLQDSDRLIQIVQASCLIAIYFFSSGRTLEGYYHSSTAARLAVSLGLHQIKSEDWYRFQPDVGSAVNVAQPAFMTFKSSLQLSTPRDSIEYLERIAAFWQVFAVDRAWSVASGLPAALPDDDSPRAQIVTTWPCEITGSSDLLDSLHQLNYMDSSKMNPSLRAKVVLLLERAYRLSSKTFESDDLFLVEHRSLDVLLTQFAEALPPLASSVYQDQLSPNDVELVSIHTLMHTAIIQLHRQYLEVNPASYQRCLSAANSITAMIRELNEGDYSFLSPIISMCWKSAADVYLEALAAQQPHLQQSILAAVNGELNLIMNALKTLGRVFSIAADDAFKLESARTMTLSSLYVAP